jgi:thymidylate synthase (FAD)
MNNNKVELIDFYGNDLMVVNAARVSFGKTKQEFDNKDERLINYLVKHKHTSVFRHPQLTFRITCPIYVERQLFKHQVGISVNSISGRYVDFSDSYTTINEWRKQSKSSKQGSEGFLSEIENNEANRIQNMIIAQCKQAYEALINMGVAKEQARTILPLNLNTTFIWTGSLLALFHLFSLRIKEDTQFETRQIAQQMLSLVEQIDSNPFKHSLAAFSNK